MVCARKSILIACALALCLIACAQCETKNSLNLSIDSNKINIDGQDVVNINDYQVDDSDESDLPGDKLDLEEISPRDNNCQFVEMRTLNQSTLTCGKIPLFCRQVCDTLHKLSFSDSLRKVSPFSFRSYKIKSYMQLNFNSALRHINTDAFNGMVVENDQTLRINIGLTDQEVAVYSLDSDEYEDELNAGNSNTNAKRSVNDITLSEIAGDNEEDESDHQIEYDIQTPSTKPDEEAMKEDSDEREQTRDLYISPNAFRGVLIKPGGRLVLTIKNYNMVTFAKYSLNSIQTDPTSSIIVNVEGSDTVVFKSKWAKQLSSPSIVSVKPGGPTLSDTVTFRVNVSNTNSVYFETESFANMELEKTSTFQLLVNKFNKVVLGKGTFANMAQKERANFELSLSNGKSIQTSEDLFSNLHQSANSKLLVNMANIADADLCLRKGTFANVLQAFNSTIRVAISTGKQNSVVFGSEAFNSIKQDTKSIFQVYMVNAYQVIVEKLAVSALTQAKSSVFELWLSKATSSLVLKNSAFKSVRQADGSSIKLSFISGPSTQGGFYQSHMLFEDFVSAPNAEVIYDFTQSTNFVLHFAPRPIPRIMPFGLIANDEKSANPRRKQTIEEMAMRMYPELGRASRPDTISLQTFRLEANDFCKVAQVPFDVLVKLSADTECSCTVYHMYRTLRLVKDKSEQEWLDHVPVCYKQKYLAQLRMDEKNEAIIVKRNDTDSFKTLNELNNLSELEKMCQFRDMIENCAQLEKDETQYFEYDKSSGQCSTTDKSFEYYLPEIVNRSPSKAVVSSSAITTNNSSLTGPNKSKNDEEEDKEEYFASGRVVQQKPVEYEANDENDDIDDDDGEVDDLLVDADDVENTSEVIMGDYDSEIGDGDDDDDNHDDADDDSTDDGLKQRVTKTQAGSSRSLFARLFDSESNAFGYFIVGLTSIILVLIIVLVGVIVKTQMNKASKGFILYDEECDDMTGSGSGNGGAGFDAYSTVNSKQTLVESMFKKSGVEKQKRYGYDVLSTDYNESLHKPVNKVLLIERDVTKRKESVTAVDDETGGEPPVSVLSIKENPLSNVV